VFVRGTDGALKQDSLRNGTWTWSDLGTPDSGSLAGSTSAVFDPAAQETRVYILGADGALKEDHNVPGAGWTWSDLGTPFGVGLDGSPNVVGYAGPTPGSFSVFVRGTDAALKEDALRDGSWTWYDRGTPNGTPLAGNPSAVVDPDTQETRVYFVGTDGALKEDHGVPDVAWFWNDLGTPSGVPLDGSPSAVGYTRPVPGSVSVFVRGTDGAMKESALRGGSWDWYNQGMPGSGPLAGSTNAVVDPGTQDTRVYLLGTDGALKEDHATYGVGWSWSDLGTPGGGGGAPVPGGSGDQGARDLKDQAFLQSEASLSGTSSPAVVGDPGAAAGTPVRLPDQVFAHRTTPAQADGAADDWVWHGVA
jgi:hypothetical protein